MKPLLPLIFMLIAAPAFAGSLAFDLPNLSFPGPTTTTLSTSGAPAPATVTKGH